MFRVMSKTVLQDVFVGYGFFAAVTASAGLTAFAAGFFSFLAAPFVGYALAVCGAAAFAGNLSLPLRAHSRKSAVRFSGLVLLRALILCHIMGVFIMVTKKGYGLTPGLAGKALQRVRGMRHGVLPVFLYIEKQVPF